MLLRSLLRAGLVVVALTGFACSDSSTTTTGDASTPDGTSQVCTPGASSACSVNGCKGFHNCLSDGSGFDSCHCEGIDAGHDAGRDATVGDAPSDAPKDATQDTTQDAPQDATSEATPDAGQDADAMSDSGVSAPALCGHCLKNAECTSNNCEAITGTCQPAGGCQSSAQCGAFACNTGLGVCTCPTLRALCEPCTNAAQCASSNCETISGTCQPTAGCQSSAECGTFACDVGLGICTCPAQRTLCDPCANNGQCVSQNCDAVTQRCQPAGGCQSNAQCGTFACDTGLGVCTCQ